MHSYASPMCTVFWASAGLPLICINKSIWLAILRLHHTHMPSGSLACMFKVAHSEWVTFMTEVADAKWVTFSCTRGLDARPVGHFSGSLCGSLVCVSHKWVTYMHPMGKMPWSAVLWLSDCLSAGLLLKNSHALLMGPPWGSCGAAMQSSYGASKSFLWGACVTNRLWLYCGCTVAVPFTIDHSEF